MTNQNKKFYKVICKCGHVGKQHYVPVQFAVCAESAKEAARQARYFPRVKHDHKDAILKVIEIDLDQFNDLNEINNNDPYLKCRSRQEQNQIADITERMVNDPHYLKNTYDQQIRKERVAYKMKKMQILENSLKKEVYNYAY